MWRFSFCQPRKHYRNHCDKFRETCDNELPCPDGVEDDGCIIPSHYAVLGWGFVVFVTFEVIAIALRMGWEDVVLNEDGDGCLEGWRGRIT